MLLNINNDVINLESLVFTDTYIIFKDKHIPIDKKHKIYITVGNQKFSLNKLVHFLKSNKEKFPITFIISEKADSLEISYEQIVSTGKFANLEVYINNELLSFFHEDEISVYIFHEIGHLLDIKNELKFERYKKNVHNLFHVLIFATLGYSYYLELNKLSQLFIMLFFPIVSILIERYLDRVLEYNADSYAVSIVKDYKKVVQAYEKINMYYGGQKRDPFIKRIFSTHPHFEDRISHLKMKYWYLIVWDFLFSHR